MNTSSPSEGQFELSSNQNGHYFQYKDKDGNILLRSKEYQTTTSRDRGIKTVLKNAMDKQKYEIKSADNDYYFVLKGGNHQPIARGVMLTSREQVEQAIKHFRQQLLAAEEEDQGSDVQLKKETPQRFSFRIDLYYSEEDRDWSGKIEYPFGKIKKALKGLDEQIILAFMKAQLPNLKTEKSLQIEEAVQEQHDTQEAQPAMGKITDFYLLKKGNRIADNLIEKSKNYELGLKIKDIAEGMYNINVFAKSLDDRFYAKIGERLCPISSDSDIFLPIATEILNDGSFRISTAIKPVNTQKNILLEEHFYTMVY